MPLYPLREAAELLGVSVDTMRRWADAGRVATTQDEQGRRGVEVCPGAEGLERIFTDLQPAG